MAIATQTTDYSGRTRDVSILQYPNSASVDAQEVFPRFGVPSRFCAGPQKLIQRYMILLLTNIGSQEFFPGDGCPFLWTLQAGISPVDNITATQIFTQANYKTVLTLKNYQVNHPNDPLDEQLASANLLGISLQGGYASFDVKLTTLAGSTVNFLVPLPK
jgi:hypothetical protein